MSQPRVNANSAASMWAQADGGHPLDGSGLPSTVSLIPCECSIRVMKTEKNNATTTSTFDSTGEKQTIWGQRQMKTTQDAD